VAQRMTSESLEAEAPAAGSLSSSLPSPVRGRLCSDTPKLLNRTLRASTVDLQNSRKWCRWLNPPTLLACAERFRILGIHFCAAPRWSVCMRNSKINPTALPIAQNRSKLKLFRSLCLLTFLTFFQLCRNHFLQVFASEYYVFCYFIELLEQSLKRFIVVLSLYTIFKRISLCITHLSDLSFVQKKFLARCLRQLKMIS